MEKLKHFHDFKCGHCLSDEHWLVESHTRRVHQVGNFGNIQTWRDDYKLKCMNKRYYDDGTQDFEYCGAEAEHEEHGEKEWSKEE